jgi:GT2 family glycosyltransferase
MSVGGTVYPAWVGAPPSWFPDAFLWVVGCSYEGLPTHTGPIRNPIGANMAFRREVFAEVGGFTEGLGRVGRLPLGCEETELCIRASQRWPHRRHVYEPAAVVRHRVPAGRGQWRYFAHRCLAEGVSKARVSRLVGATAGLASERAYTTQILPRAAARALRKGRAAEGGAIIAGLTVTAAGYLSDQVRGRHAADCLENAMGQPLPPLPCYPPATVIVATRHRAASLGRCLTTLADLDYPDFEIVVVDNGPSDDTRDAVAQHGGARYLVEERPGASRARNRGLSAATGQIIAVTDDDAVVDRDWLRGLVAGFARAENVACVTGLVLPASLDTDAERWFEEYGGFNKGYQPRLFDLHTKGDGIGPLYPYTAGLFGSGNNVAFRADVLRSLGGYDVALGPGTPTKSAEELDLFLGLLMAGYRIAYEPSAVVKHAHRSSYDELLTQLHDYGIGLSALITKWALRSPRHAAEMIGRLPAGVQAVVAPGSFKNAGRSSTYPRQLKRAEWKGLARGPLAYRQAVKAAR